MAAPDPSGAGVALALHRAPADAAASPADVVHVNAHATATVDGDLAEANALTTVLSGRRVPVTALKGSLGHLQGAAGAVEALVTALTLHHGVIPPTIGCADQDHAITLDLVTTAPAPSHPKATSPSPTPSASAATTRSSRYGAPRSPGRCAAKRGLVRLSVRVWSG